MATQAEVEQCFEALREQLNKSNEAAMTKFRSELSANTTQYKPVDERIKNEMAEHELNIRLIFMGLFLAESFLIDVKRVADTLDAIDRP
jgi:hypothetical protein